MWLVLLFSRFLLSFLVHGLFFCVYYLYTLSAIPSPPSPLPPLFLFFLFLCFLIQAFVYKNKNKRFGNGGESQYHREERNQNHYKRGFWLPLILILISNNYTNAVINGKWTGFPITILYSSIPDIPSEKYKEKIALPIWLMED